jgi:hypothetical protein
MAALNLILTGKGEQAFCHFVAFVKDNCVGFFSHLVYQLCFHGDLGPLWR